MEWLLGELRKEGVTRVDETETFNCGKFVHILDPEGNKIELCEAIEPEFDKITKGKTK